MAINPLSNAARDQMELHTNALRELAGDFAACQVANEMIDLFETLAGNFPGTGFDVCVGAPAGTQPDLSVAEKNAFMGRINALTTIVEDTPPGAVTREATDVANEMLELFEERALNLQPPSARGQRDVREQQLP